VLLFHNGSTAATLKAVRRTLRSGEMQMRQTLFQRILNQRLDPTTGRRRHDFAQFNNGSKNRSQASNYANKLSKILQMQAGGTNDYVPQYQYVG
jgi:hypothetical protein